MYFRLFIPWGRIPKYRITFDACTERQCFNPANNLSMMALRLQLGILNLFIPIISLHTFYCNVLFPPLSKIM